MSKNEAENQVKTSICKNLKDIYFICLSETQISVWSVWFSILDHLVEWPCGDLKIPTKSLIHGLTAGAFASVAVVTFTDTVGT